MTVRDRIEGFFAGFLAPLVALVLVAFLFVRCAKDEAACHKSKCPGTMTPQFRGSASNCVCVELARP